MAEKKSTGLVDANAMYNIGYGANKDADDNQEIRFKLINSALGKIGGMVFDRISSSYKTLGTLRDQAGSAGDNMDDSLLSLDNQESALAINGRKNLVLWQGELDDALKQQSLSFSPKKRRAAKLAATKIYKKMNTMKGDLTFLSERKKIDVASGLKILGEKHKMGDDFEGWSEGMATSEFEMSAMLAGGQLTEYMTVDPETGNVVLTEQDSRSKEALIADGFSQAEADEMIESGGNLTPVITNLRDLKFAPSKDGSVSAYQIAGLENAMKHGGSGGSWDGNYASIRKADIANFLDTAPSNAVRSAYFSKTGFGADGLMSGNSPAYDFLISQGYEPGTNEWLAGMEIEKAKKFEIGSKERNDLGVTLLAGEKKYYENSKEKYDADNPTKDNRANVMVNGGLMNPTDYDAAYGESSGFTMFLNSESVLGEGEAEEMVTPGGYEYQRRFDGIYQLTGVDNEGKKVYDKKITTDGIKRNEKLPGVTKSLIPDLKGDNKEEEEEEEEVKVPNSETFKWNLGISGRAKAVDGWRKEFPDFKFDNPGTRKQTVNITAPNGKTLKIKLGSSGGDKVEEAKVFNKFIEDNKNNPDTLKGVSQKEIKESVARGEESKWNVGPKGEMLSEGYTYDWDLKEVVWVGVGPEPTKK